MFTAAAAAGAFLMRDANQMIRAGHARHARELASALAAIGAPAFAANDHVELSRLCDRLVQGGSVMRVAFVEGDGKIIAAADSDGAPFPRHPENEVHWRKDARWAGERMYRDPRFGLVMVEASCPVPGRLDSHDGRSRRAAGFARLTVAAQTGEGAASPMAIHFGWLFALMLVLAAPLTFVVVRSVVRPLREMTAAARRFAEDDLSPRVPVHGDDEIADLAGALNAMADGLTASRAELLQFNVELGYQVEERTRALRDLATRDPLTNLYNRRHFAEVLRYEFAEAVRYGHELALVMVDLDNFKGINDTHGHRVGDDVLLLTARMIAGELRASDIAARYGGDEFILLLPHTSAADAEALADRIHQALRAAAKASIPQAHVDISLGIASLAETDATSPEALIHAVDAALYEVKRSGKGRIAHARPAPRLLPV